MSAQTRSARGQPCTLRFFGGGCHGDVVACHWKPEGQGRVGTKVDDLFTVFGCQRCHAVLDRSNGDWRAFSELDRVKCLNRAIFETLTIKMDLGIVRRDL